MAKSQVKVNLSGGPKLDEKTALVEQTNIQKKIASLTIKGQGDYTKASELLVWVKKYIGSMTEVLQPGLDALNTARNVIIAQKKKYIAPAEALEKQLKDKMADYEVEQDRIRDLAASAAIAQAEKDAEKDRATLRRKADKAKDPDKKEALLDAANQIMATPLVLDRAVDKGEGITSRDDVEITIIDLHAFLGYVHQNTHSSIPLEPMIIIKIGGVKEFLKFHGLKECPGLTIKKTKIISAGGGGM